MPGKRGENVMQMGHVEGIGVTFLCLDPVLQADRQQ